MSRPGRVERRRLVAVEHAREVDAIDIGRLSKERWWILKLMCGHTARRYKPPSFRYPPARARCDHCPPRA
jgi:hypothetical protein